VCGGAIVSVISPSNPLTKAEDGIPQRNRGAGVGLETRNGASVERTRHTASLPAPRSQKPEARSTEHRRQKQNQKQKREARSPPLLRAAVGERRTRRPRYIPVSPISPPPISPEGIPRASGAPHPAGTSPGRRAPPGGGYFFCSTKTEHRAPGRLSIRRPGL
jgi:hypothetical protein